jgi:hypothetical protein
MTQCIKTHYVGLDVHNAWRSWLLLYGLPAWLTVLGVNAGPGDSPGG